MNNSETQTNAVASTPTDSTTSPISKTVSSSTQPIAKMDSSSKTILMAIAGVFGTFCFLCFCCFMSFGFLFRLAFSSVEEGLDRVEILCNADENDLDNIYKEAFTARYKKENSFREFEAFYQKNKNFFGTCDENLSDISWSDFANDFSFDVSRENDITTIKISLTKEGETLDVVLITEDDELKIDDISVISK